MSESVCSVLAPKLLGTYECELGDWIERLVAEGFPMVLNIGAAEGYYSVGFAWRCPQTRIVAFEGEPTGRALIAELAARNCVTDRIAIDGFGTPETLRSYLDNAVKPLLIVDIEGGELDLLDPAKLPVLQHCFLLVELHEAAQPVAEILRTRFTASHYIAKCWTRPRDLRDLTTPMRIAAWILGRRRFLKALNEQRPGPMRWFLCEPREAVA
ncbi:MAG: hypothetical protein PHQ04_07195 [Opitutaceae bacterium]|nr:hypothetical protein [Opitutaceae bacterium]